MYVLKGDTDIFSEDRSFLMKMIEKDPKNEKLIELYKVIIEKDCEYSIALLKKEESIDKNITERIKSEDEVEKARIQKGN